MCRDFDWFEWFFRQRAITERTVIQTEGGRGEDSFQTESGHGENSFSDRAITERTVIQTDGFPTKGVHGENSFSDRGRSLRGWFFRRRSWREWFFRQKVVMERTVFLTEGDH